MKLTMPNIVTRTVGNQSLAISKASPKVLFGAGLVLMGATVITASRATLRLETVISNTEKQKVALGAAVEAGEIDEREYKKLSVLATANGAASVAKLYLPAIALGVAAVGCLTASHTQLSRRNAGLSAALAATERALDNYRTRVREELGEDKERSIWRGEKEIEVPVLDSEGRETKSKVKKKIGGGHSPYARIWGRDTTNEWSPESPYNLAKLQSVQEMATLRLRARGHLFLNEVLDDLGLERTPAGQVVGWLSTENGGDDGYVDFGIIQKGGDPKFIDFLTGDEDHILLDFNVDGEIWKAI